MKRIKIIIAVFLVLTSIGCTDDDRDTNFVDNTPPSNVNITFLVTQDNTGLVSVTPSGEGATEFDVYLGDGTETVITLNPGESIDNVYPEGTYEVKVIAKSISGQTTEVTRTLVVSFMPPQNLEVTIENDPAISKKVNIIATAEYAVSYEVNFGENAEGPIISANIGDEITHTYEEAGVYTITVTAMGAAIETTTYTEEFEVTAIEAPLASAPTPPSRADGDVISIFSAAYTDVEGTNYFPDWGQGGQGSSWALFNLDGDDMLQYVNLSYQGIALADGITIDVSGMEYLHLDVWTAEDVTDIETSLINNASGTVTEAPVTTSLNAVNWTSIDIPISEYTDQGLTVTEIFQLKFVGTPWAAGTVFIDNIYFYKQPSGTITSMIEDFEGTPPTFTVFGDIAPIDVITNPDPSGINLSDNVARLTKTNGSQFWAGAFFEVSTPLDLNTYNKINVKTWSPNNGVVKLKLENADASITWEVDLNTTTTNAWENLLYDFSGAPAADYVRIVIFFDFGNNGDGSEYYFDDIELVNNDGGPAPLSFEDFEGTPPSFTVFGDIAPTEVISNPDPSGINTTSNVAQLTKTNGSQFWAGTFFELSNPLDFNNYSKISVNTWSPNVGVVKLKIENADASVTHEVDLNPAATNSWEKLVYDFSEAPVADYVRVVIFFDFGNVGDGSLYYFDEFELTN